MKKLLILLAFFPVIVLAQPNTVNVGSSANDGTGDPIRTAFTKLNANDAAAYDSIEAINNRINDTIVIADTLTITFCIPDSSMLRLNTWIAWSQNNSTDTMHIASVNVTTPHSGSWDFDYNLCINDTIDYSKDFQDAWTTDRTASGSDLYSKGQSDTNPNNPYIAPNDFYMIEIREKTTPPPYGASFTLNYYVY